MRVVGAMCGVLALAAVARAEGVVLEVVAGTRAADAEAPLGRVREALAREGFLAAPDDVRNLIDTRLSSASAPRTDDALETLSRTVDDGYSAYLAGSFSLALERLPAALEAFHSSPAIAARDQTKRDLIFKALVGIALAHGRLHHENLSLGAMEELARSFGDRDFNRTLYGPEAHDLFRKARARLERRGRGNLDVKVTGATSALVFVNEHYEGVGAIHKGDLLPGTYRVYTQLGSQIGRVQRVDVKPGETASITVDWELAAALRSDTWVGLLFTDEKARSAREARIAGRIAQALAAQRVAVIGVTGKRVVVGRVYDPTGKVTAQSSVPLAALEKDARAVDTMVAALVGKPAVAATPPEPKVITPTPAPAPVPSAAPPVVETRVVEAVTSTAPRSSSRRSSLRPWAWVSLGLGLAAAGGGAYLLEVDGTCDGGGDTGNCANLRDTRTPGLVLLGGGGALALTGVILFFVGGGDDGPKVAAVPTAGGAAVAGAWTF